MCRKTSWPSGVAIDESNLELADSLIAEERVENLAVEFQQLVVRVLALQQPRASDFRTVISALGVATALKNMAEMTWHIAELVHSSAPRPTVEASLRADFAELGRIDVELAEHLHRLLSEGDTAAGATIRELDATIDGIHGRVLETLLAPSWGGTTADAVNATLALRYYKRFSHNGVVAASRLDYQHNGEWLAEPISSWS